MEERNKGKGIAIAIAIAFALCLLMYFYMLWASQSVNNETKVIPNAGYEMYVTIDAGTETYRGEAVIIAVNEEITVIQMEGQTYIAPTNKVSYE